MDGSLCSPCFWFVYLIRLTSLTLKTFCKKRKWEKNWWCPPCSRTKALMRRNCTLHLCQFCFPGWLFRGSCICCLVWVSRQRVCIGVPHVCALHITVMMTGHLAICWPSAWAEASPQTAQSTGQLLTPHYYLLHGGQRSPLRRKSGVKKSLVFISYVCDYSCLSEQDQMLPCAPAAINHKSEHSPEWGANSHRRQTHSVNRRGLRG